MSKTLEKIIKQVTPVLITKLGECKGLKQVYVISKIHPSTINTINLDKVTPPFKEHVTAQLRKWLNDKVLYKGKEDE